MTGWIAIAMGGALGAMLRHGFGLGVTAAGLGSGAVATLGVNVIGSGLMGAFLGWIMERNVPGESTLWLFMGVGVFGAFTTFSAFSRETVHMINTGEHLKALAYSGASVLLSVGALFMTLMAARKVFA